MTDNNPFNGHRIESLENYENEQSEVYTGSNSYSPRSIEDFTEQYQNESDIDTEVWTLSGRIIRENEFGDFVFYDLNDRTDIVQVMCSVDNRSDFETDSYQSLENVNIGDRVVFVGQPAFSDTGELTLNATEYELVAKSLQDFSRDHNQLSEDRLITDRTAALSTSDDLYNTVRTRFEIQQNIREYLNENNYTEVETPILHSQPDGANATPFETYCEALDEDVYLRVAPELYLKRLIVSGYDAVYEMSRCFRNEDIDTTHNPEFTMLELYETYADYEDMMSLTENIFSSVAREIHGTTEIEYNNQVIDVSTPWERIRFDDAMSDLLGQRVGNVSDNSLIERGRTRGYLNDESSELTRDALLMEVFENEIEDDLRGPVFVTDYPVGSTPLCQTVDNNDSRVQRFESFISGMEVANSYTELTDPREQYDRLLEQANGDENAVNNEFVEALSYGMPPTAGLGIGIDRLVMVMTDSQSIKDILPYPMTDGRI